MRCTDGVILLHTDDGILLHTDDVILLHTDGVLHSNGNIAGAAAANNSAAAVEAAVRAAIARVHVIVVDTSAALVDCLDRLEENVIRYDAKLIVVDSMA